MTPTQDIVLLDTGSGDVNIYVIATNSGQLKSAISAKHESCGPLRGPSSVSLDHTNRIVLADPSEKRLLMFSARKAPKTQSRNKIDVRKMSAFNAGEQPVGAAFGAHATCFVLLQSDGGFSVRVFRCLE